MIEAHLAPATRHPGPIVVRWLRCPRMAADRQPAQAPRARRLLEVTAFVGALIVIGELLDADKSAAREETYLLLTIPFTAAFQLLVRRRPITDLWVRGSPRITRTRITWAADG